MKTLLITISVIITAFLIVRIAANREPQENTLAVTAPTPDTTANPTKTLMPERSLKQKSALPVVNYYNQDNLTIEKPNDNYRYDNVQLYPIYASAKFLNHHKNIGPYLSLQEALAHHNISIMETGEQEGGEVNTLFIENTSPDTVIIMGGEVIRGGKQDRMIANDFMVLPHSGKIDIDVFCVEHNRWMAHDVDAAFTVATGVAPANVRQAAKTSDAQMQVWEEVEALYKSYPDVEVEEDTKALAPVLDSEDMKDYLEPYYDKLQNIVWPTHVVGIVAVMDGNVVGCDIFAQHQLFTKYYKSLLHSYCGKLHASSYEEPMPYAKVKSFFKTILHDETALEAKINEQGTQLKNGQYRIHAAVY